MSTIAPIVLPPAANSRRALLPATIAIAGLLAGACLFLWDPACTSFFPPCIFHSLTGLYCPGCGSQRALHQLLHGRILPALAYNPLMVVFIPILLLHMSQLLLRQNGLVVRPLLSRGGIAWVILACVVFFWIGRNIPVWPLSLLAPHHLG